MCPIQRKMPKCKRKALATGFSAARPNHGNGNAPNLDSRFIRSVDDFVSASELNIKDVSHLKQAGR